MNIERGSDEVNRGLIDVSDIRIQQRRDKAQEWRRINGNTVGE
jgi:hypothetical protein